MCAYYGYDTTFWLRSEGSIGRTQPKIERYTNMMLEDLRQATALVGSPMGRFLYPKAAGAVFLFSQSSSWNKKSSIVCRYISSVLSTAA